MRSLLILVIGLLIATCAFAQSTTDFQKCASSEGTADEHIAACTRAITSGQLSSAQLVQTFYNRGLTWYSKGDYDRAIADHNEAIRLNPQYAPAYSDRGLAQFYLGRFEASAADFAQSLRLNRDQPYRVIWRYLALARSQNAQSASSELSASAAPLDKQKWPAPVIELLAGGLDPSALLKAAEHSDSGIRRAQLCEAEFFLGEWHLLNRRPTEARVLLQSAERNCPATFVESTAATVELRRLGQ